MRRTSWSAPWASCHRHCRQRKLPVWQPPILAEATIAEAKATLDVVVDRLTGGKSNEVVKVDDLPRYRDADLEKTFGRP